MFIKTQIVELPFFFSPRFSLRYSGH